MSYPIHITNIYELLGEEGEQPKVLPVAPKGDLKTTQSSKPSTKASSSQPQKTTSTGRDSLGKLHDGAPQDNQRKEKGGGNKQENRPPRQNRGGFSGGAEFRSAPSGDASVIDQQNKSRDRGERQGGRDGESRGERRGRGAPAGGFVGNKRVFDRRSGTGSRGREFKKGGAGRGNWGREDGTEVTEEGQTEEGKESTTEEAKAQEPVEPKEETEEEKLEREEREKEAKMITLGDYLKQKESSKQLAQFALPEVRKTNEGADVSEEKKWGKFQALKRDEEVAQSAKDKKKKEKEKEKNTVPLEAVFNVKEHARPREDRPYREGRGGGRGGRGGRGGGRGGRGRGGYSGSNRGDNESAPQFDLNSFPTLGETA